MRNYIYGVLCLFKYLSLKDIQTFQRFSCVVFERARGLCVETIAILQMCLFFFEVGSLAGIWGSPMRLAGVL